jgi:predicted RNA methylase
MADGDYDTLAAVYEFLVPDAVLTPQGSADAFAAYVAPSARVLDCACGTGTLAVGLALRGCGRYLVTARRAR